MGGQSRWWEQTQTVASSARPRGLRVERASAPRTLLTVALLAIAIAAASFALPAAAQGGQPRGDETTAPFHEVVSAGTFHTCALLTSGNVHCWGYDVKDYEGGDATQVTAGGFHTCALLTSGNVHCWGSNGYGQSEDYTGADATQITAGGFHTCALLISGNVHCWGDNRVGQSEDYAGGDATQITTGWRHTCALLTSGNARCWGDDDGQSEDYAGGDATQITAGDQHTCALLMSGNVHCWGDNRVGQSEDYAGGDATQTTAGGSHTCVLLTNGTADCWGRNEYGKSEDYAGGDATQIAAGASHTCALLTRGNVHCWGRNDFGQGEDYKGGDATQITAGQKHTCALLTNGTVHCWGDNDFGQSKDHASGGVTQITAGGWHTCALLTSGTVHCWGAKGGGPIELVKGGSRREDYAGGDATQITAGDWHTCALLASGNVHCWGNNEYGQSEDYTGGDATHTTAGLWHTCARLTSGNVHCWGRNHAGQSANYTDGGAIQVTAGLGHTCVLLATGNVHCWGLNGHGRSEDYAGDDATQVTSGEAHTCALITNGNVHCWGDIHDYEGGDVRQPSTRTPGPPTEDSSSQSRRATSAIWVGEYAYIFGGVTQGGVTDEILRYHPATDTVSMMSATLPIPLAETSVVWDGQYAYIFGGIGRGGVEDSIIRYDPAADVIKLMQAHLPTARMETSAIWSGRFAYVFGGQDARNETRDDILRYEPATDKLTTINVALPTPLRETSAIWDGHHAFIFGGDARGFGPEHAILDTVLRFDPVTNRANTVGALPSRQHATSAFWDGTHAFIFGLHGVFRFDPSNGSSAAMRPQTPSDYEHDTSAIWDGTQAYVFGGWTHDKIVRYNPKTGIATLMEARLTAIDEDEQPGRIPPVLPTRAFFRPGNTVVRAVTSDAAVPGSGVSGRVVVEGREASAFRLRCADEEASLCRIAVPIHLPHDRSYRVSIHVEGELVETVTYAPDLESCASVPRGGGRDAGPPLVVLVHGLFGSDESLGNLYRDLKEDPDFADRVARVEYGSSRGDHIIDYARDVQRQILALPEFGDGRDVVIVGHSMGGLVARALVELPCHGPADDPILEGWDATVVGAYFLGTPHGGTHRDVLPKLLDATIKTGVWSGALEDLTVNSLFLADLPDPTTQVRHWVNVVGTLCGDEGDCVVRPDQQALPGGGSLERAFPVCHTPAACDNPPSPCARDMHAAALGPCRSFDEDDDVRAFILGDLHSRFATADASAAPGSGVTDQVRDSPGGSPGSRDGSPANVPGVSAVAVALAGTVAGLLRARGGRSVGPGRRSK